MRGWIAVLLVWLVMAMAGFAYQMVEGRPALCAVKHYGTSSLEPIRPFYVFTRAFADSIVVASPDTICATENTMDRRYIRRLLVELLTYLPANKRPEPVLGDLLYRLPPTPAQELRREAEQLQRQADRLERAEKLRAEVEQAISWLDSTGSDSDAVRELWLTPEECEQIKRIIEMGVE